ncbi:MAG: phosphotransferase [Spirochaetota bacterium]
MSYLIIIFDNINMFADYQIHNFIKSSTGESYEVSKLKGDASAREYYRINSGNKSYMLCIDNNLKGITPEQYAFCIVHNLLRKNGIPVPDIYSIDEKAGLLLIQDLGDSLIEQNFESMSKSERAGLYGDLIDTVAKIQFISGDEKTVPFSLSFDVPKLMYEFNFFIDNALIGYFKSGISGDLLEELRSEFNKISVILYKPELFVLNHRDLHSRNIMIRDSKPYLIDFQDARMGLPQYDVVSLLRDSYLRIEDGLVDSLKKKHFNILKARGYSRMEYDEYEYYFDIMAFQRNVKALGTFGYQVTTLGKNLYQRYIMPTMAYLKDYIKRRSDLSGAAGILKRFIEVDW